MPGEGLRLSGNGAHDTGACRQQILAAHTDQRIERQGVFRCALRNVFGRALVRFFALARCHGSSQCCASGPGTSNASDSAISAGFDEPSISMVFSAFIRN